MSYMYKSQVENRTVGQSVALALADSLTAVQSPGLVTVRAVGKKPSVGHDVRLQVTPVAVFPAEYRLILLTPLSPAENEATTFLAEARFPAQELIKRIFVTDSEGRHEVLVEQAADIKFS